LRCLSIVRLINRSAGYGADLKQQRGKKRGDGLEEGRRQAMDMATCHENLQFISQITAHGQRIYREEDTKNGVEVTGYGGKSTGGGAGAKEKGGRENENICKILDCNRLQTSTERLTEEQKEAGGIVKKVGHRRRAGASGGKDKELSIREEN
jgi:hypothetical protein